MSIVITTPTGQIGRHVVERLLEANADVTVLVRDPSRLPESTRTRVRVVTGALEDGVALRSATEGARAFFLLIPPSYTTTDWAGMQRHIGRVAADAISHNAVPRVVLLSSAGAQRDDMFGISRLGEVERLIGSVCANVTSLRPGFFMENFLTTVHTIASDGAVYMTLPATRRLPVVSVRDIAAVAAEALLDSSWVGHHVRGIHGPADITMSDAAAAFSSALGRDVRYVQVPGEAMRDGLLAMGASEHVASEYPRLMHATGTIDYVAEARDPRTTTPTTIDTWAREVLAPAVGAMSR